MTRASKPDKAKRMRYSTQFQSEALVLAERLGFNAAAKQLGLHSSGNPPEK